MPKTCVAANGYEVAPDVILVLTFQKVNSLHGFCIWPSTVAEADVLRKKTQIKYYTQLFTYSLIFTTTCLKEQQCANILKPGGILSIPHNIFDAACLCNILTDTINLVKMMRMLHKGILSLKTPDIFFPERINSPLKQSQDANESLKRTISHSILQGEGEKHTQNDL